VAHFHLNDIDMRSTSEIERQVAGLLNMKNTLPEYSAFGDNNWEGIDAQVAIISGRDTSDDYEDGDYYSEALDAEDWLNSSTTEDLFD